MGCDIHCQAEKRDVGGEWKVIPGLRPFSWRDYSVFGFLADVRNYSDVPPISGPRGLPDDAYMDDKTDLGDHSYSWLSVTELLEFDYDKEVEDRRICVQTSPNSWNHGATSLPGGGRMTTYREFLGRGFFKDLEELRVAGAERIVFGFDS